MVLKAHGFSLAGEHAPSGFYCSTQDTAAGFFLSKSSKIHFLSVRGETGQ
jgi:hypothetical protein